MRGCGVCCVEETVAVWGLPYWFSRLGHGVSGVIGADIPLVVNRRVFEKHRKQRAIGRTVTGKELIAAAHAMDQMKSQAQFMKKLVGMLVITMCLLVACPGQ